MPSRPATLATDPDPPAHRSAEQSRRRAIHAYVYVVMPAIIAWTMLVLALTAWQADDPPRSGWIVVGSVAVLHAGIMLALRLGMEPVRVAAASIALQLSVLVVGLQWSPNPVGGSSAAIFFIVVAAYFLPVRWSLAFTLCTTAALTLQSHRIEAWDEPYAFPSTAFATALVGAVATFIMERARRTEQELERTAGTQLEALHRLEQVDRSRDRLIANVSHELRTPLTSTIGAVETLLREDVRFDDDTGRRLLHVARDGGLRLLLLVEDLLTLGVTRPDSLELSTDAERLASLVRDAIVGIDAGEGRRIVLDAIEDPLVRVDRLRMLQVISNLVVNAVRHGRGDVRVQTDRIDGNGVIRVVDDGDGVAAEHVDELFLPFARFSSRPDSTGLGLAICRTIVEAHGGTIAYDRIDGRTVFGVSVPLGTA